MLSKPYASAASSSKRPRQDTSRPPRQQAPRHAAADAGLSRPSPTAVSQEAAYQVLPQELLSGPLAKALQVGGRPVGCPISSPHYGRLGLQPQQLGQAVIASCCGASSGHMCLRSPSNKMEQGVCCCSCQRRRARAAWWTASWHRQFAPTQKLTAGQMSACVCRTG